jgi:hypothetical protein
MSYKSIIYQKKRDNTFIVFLPDGVVETPNEKEVKEVINDYLDSLPVTE